MLSPLRPSRFPSKVLVLFGLSEPQRYSLFENLFKAFGIAKRVVHSTSQNRLQPKGNIRQLVRDLITGNSQVSPI